MGLQNKMVQQHHLTSLSTVSRDGFWFFERIQESTPLTEWRRVYA